MTNQIKSKDRVKELGEVFTNIREVRAMLDLLPEVTVETTFLEPSCGNGAFVLEILRRKFNMCKSKKDYITALKSVYAIDIMQDNIEECKHRVISLWKKYNPKANEKEIKFIVDTQIFQGNSLAIMKLLEFSEVPVNVVISSEVEFVDE